MKDVSKASKQMCAWGRWKTVCKAAFSREPAEVILALRLTFLGRKLITFLMHLSYFGRGQLRDHSNPAGYLYTTKPLQKEAPVSLKEENPTGNVGAVISSNKQSAAGSSMCRLQMKKKFHPRTGYHGSSFPGSVSSSSSAWDTVSQGQQIRTACRKTELALGVCGRQH